MEDNNWYDKCVGLDFEEALSRLRSNDGRLTHLSFWCKRIGDKGARELAGALKGNNSLTHLKLGRNEMGAEGALALGEGLKGNDTLTHLALWQNKIGAEGARSLGGGLKENKTLMHLSLRYNEIGADGAGALAGVLMENGALQHLDLEQNEIGAEGARALGEVLKENDTLAHLDLGGNKIGDEGAQALAEVLKGNDALAYLELEGNEIGAEGARALAEGLKENDTLKHLDLGYNVIGDEGARAIAEGLKESPNNALTYLGLRSNEIGDEGASAEGYIGGWIIRNKLLQVHGEGIQKEGFYFYFRENGNGSSVCIEETVWKAATTGDGQVLGLVQEVLKTHLDECSEDALRTEKESLKKLFDDTRSTGGSSLLHIAADLESKGALVLCQFLVEEIGVDFDATTDKAGRTARDIAQGNANAETSKWAKSVGTFLGRYFIEERGKYKSATCTVHFAVDVEKPKGDPDRNVALKIMEEQDQFERELNIKVRDDYQRVGSGVDIGEGRNRFDKDHVVPLLRYNDTPFKGKLHLCLVMPKGERNLDEIIRYEGIAGRDVNAIIYYATDMAEGLLHMHVVHELIHADAKPRNVIRIQGDLKFIDNDASVKIGSPLTGKISTGYGLPPEGAKVKFRPDESEDDLLKQKELLEEEKKKAIADDDNGLMMKTLVKLQEVETKIKQLNSLTAATPEEKLRANVQIDIWSYGVMMYQMLTGRSLFDCDLNDNLLDKEKEKLLNWKGISEEDLSHVLVDCQDRDLVKSAKDLLCACLSTEETRPKSFYEVLGLPFLNRKQAQLQEFKEELHYMKEHFDSRFDRAEKRLEQIDLKLDKALEHFQAQFNILETLLHDGNNKLAPKFICFLPESTATPGKNWLQSAKTFNPSKIFNKSVRVFFIDPIRMQIAPTNNGDGFTLKVPKAWVIKAMPYIKLSLTVLKVAYIAGRLSGFPVPDVEGVVGDWIDGQLVELEGFTADAKDWLSKQTSDPDVAKGLLDELDMNARKAINENIDAMKPVGGETLSEKFDEPIKKSFTELDNLLSEFGHWREQCGLVLTTSSKDGTSEYILQEDIEQFNKKGALMLSEASRNVPSRPEPSEPEPNINVPHTPQQTASSRGSQMGPPSEPAASCCIIV